MDLLRRAWRRLFPERCRACGLTREEAQGWMCDRGRCAVVTHVWKDGEESPPCPAPGWDAPALDPVEREACP